MALTRITSDGITDGSILNADLHSSAAIARTKLANVDLVDDTTPQLGGDLQSNGNNIDLADDDKILIGADDDLQIFHSGNTNQINTGTKVLKIHGGSNNASAIFGTTTSRAVELFFDNNKRIETTNAGATITGDATISQDLTVRGIAATGNLSVNNTNPSITLVDDSHNFKLDVNGNLFAIRDNTNLDAIRFSIDDSGTVDVTGNLDVGAGLDVTGNITVTGTVDGRDLATDGSKLDGIASGATNVTNTNQLTNGAGFLTSVTQGDIANGAVGQNQLASGAVITTKLSDNNVTFAKLENIPQNRVIGRIASGSGDPTTLTPANIRSMLNVEDGATADQTASEILTLIKTVDGSGSGLDADTLDGVSSASFLRSDSADTASSDITFSGGAGAVTISGNSDITFNNGSSWSGNQTKIAHHGNYLYIVGGSSGIAFRKSGTNRAFIDGSGHFVPGANNTYDLGSNSTRWRNVYTSDLVLSNEGSSNDVDGTWGSYTIQEGEESLFLINKRNGKKYKFNLTEVN